eukprot:UN04744
MDEENKHLRVHLRKILHRQNTLITTNIMKIVNITKNNIIIILVLYRLNLNPVMFIVIKNNFNLLVFLLQQEIIKRIIVLMYLLLLNLNMGKTYRQDDT